MNWLMSAQVRDEGVGGARSLLGCVLLSTVPHAWEYEMTNTTGVWYKGWVSEKVKEVILCWLREVGEMSEWVGSRKWFYARPIALHRSISSWINITSKNTRTKSKKQTSLVKADLCTRTTLRPLEMLMIPTTTHVTKEAPLPRESRVTQQL